MRLLEWNSAGEFTLTRDFSGDDVPKYAILLHTWGADTDEASFKDLMNCTGTSKPGHKRIRLCGEQAIRDGLLFIWVDICCIDKSSSAELQEAINSMFECYRKSTVWL